MEKRSHYFNKREDSKQNPSHERNDQNRILLGRVRIDKRKSNLEDAGFYEEAERKEIHKTLIKNSQEYLQTLFKQFGIKAKDITIADVHFTENIRLSHLNTNIQENGNVVLGNYIADQSIITVYYDKNNFNRSLKTLIHESLHYNSFQTFDSRGDFNFDTRRVGLRVQDRLHYLNEGFTEYLANKNIYDFIKNHEELKEDAEKILKNKFKYKNLNEYNVTIITVPNYPDEVSMVRDILSLLTNAYGVDVEEAEKWIGDAYFTGNLLQLFQKIKKVTDPVFVKDLMELNNLDDADEEHVKKLRQQLRYYVSKYDKNIHDTIEDTDNLSK